MLEKERESEQFGKLLESISDDLFLLKLELKVIRIDDLLDKDGDVFNEYEDNLKTPFQRMFFCKRWLKNHIFWEGYGKENINEVIDQLYNNLKACEGLDRKELVRFVDRAISEKDRQIEYFKKMVLKGEITSNEYRKEAMTEFERDKIGLSRIEALYRLNQIQWLYEVLEQMERHFKRYNKLDDWKYEMSFNCGSRDERTTLGF